MTRYGWCMLLALTALTASVPVHRGFAQSYPERPITLVVGIAAGGAPDIIGRLYAERVSKFLGQRMIVENRSGAGGIPAAMSVKQAPADGYTVLFQYVGLHTTFAAIQQLPFDPLGDFTPVTPLYSTPGFLTISGSNPANSVQELVAYGKTRPEGLTFGTTGAGSAAHLMAALFQDKTGVKTLPVQYRSGAQAVTDLIPGRIDASFLSYTNFSTQIGTGVKVLAIAADKRWDGTANIPTLSELGYPDIDVDNLFGIAVVAGTPPAIVKRLNEAFAEAARDPELLRRLAELGAVNEVSTPEALQKILLRDTARLGPLVKRLGIQAQ